MKTTMKTKTKEKLVCNCGNDKKHREYKDANGEKVIECEKCKRFLKFKKG